MTVTERQSDHHFVPPPLLPTVASILKRQIGSCSFLLNPTRSFPSCLTAGGERSWGPPDLPYLASPSATSRTVPGPGPSCPLPPLIFVQTAETSLWTPLLGIPQTELPSPAVRCRWPLSVQCLLRFWSYLLAVLSSPRGEQSPLHSFPPQRARRRPSVVPEGVGKGQPTPRVWLRRDGTGPPYVGRNG